LELVVSMCGAAPNREFDRRDASAGDQTRF
jgi:hypothetical protein